MTVGATGAYDVAAFGGQGGRSFYGVGGYGAEEDGSFTLQAGERLEIVVGGEGGYGCNKGGGGGGTFVLAQTAPGSGYSLILAAGGGGGGAFSSTSQGYGSGLANPGSNHGQGGHPEGFAVVAVEPA